MDFAHVGFAVCVDHEGVDLLAVFQCADHGESAICGGEWHIHEFQSVID